MCEHTIRVRQRVDANEITLCNGFFGGFNLRVETNMHSIPDAEAERDTGISFPKLKYSSKKLTVNLANK